MLGCGYLIYLVVTYFIRQSPDEMPFSPEVRIVIIVFFLLAAAALIFLSVREFFRNYKVGFYNESFYTSDLGAGVTSDDEEGGSAEGAESEGGDAEAAIKDDMGDDDLYYDEGNMADETDEDSAGDK